MICKILNFKKSIKWFFFLSVFLGIIYNARNYLDIFSWVQSNYRVLCCFADENFLIAMIIFFIVRFLFAVISIPGTGVLTLLAGAVFGFFVGFALVLSSITLGVFVAFLLTRYIIKEPVKRRFKKHFDYIDKIGNYYGGSLLFLLRLLEVVPSFVINSFFALTPMTAKTYFWVSFISIAPGVLVVTNMGTQLSEIKELSDLISYQIVISLAVIGAIPMISKLIYQRYSKTRRERRTFLP